MFTFMLSVIPQKYHNNSCTIANDINGILNLKVMTMHKLTFANIQGSKGHRWNSFHFDLNKC